LFEQTNRLAEKLAAGVSRRGFLGSLGGWAAAAALGVAGLLTGAGTARAGNVVTCCYYGAVTGACAKPRLCAKDGGPCPPNPNCFIVSRATFQNCNECLRG
jgi:hypothetical protein